MKTLKRGDVVKRDVQLARVLGPEDFEGYDRNNPTRHTGSQMPWELIEYLDNGQRAWAPSWTLTKVSDEA